MEFDEAKQELLIRGAVHTLQENFELKKEIAIASSLALGLFHVLERKNGSGSAGYNGENLCQTIRDATEQARLLPGSRE